jgi:hypothetical protein
VLEIPPEPPTQPSFESAVDYATPPNYDGKSKYTVRFVHPGKNRRVHVYRALDKAVFRTDWERRRAGEATRELDATDVSQFPPYRRDNDSSPRREAIRDEIASLHDAVSAESTFAEAFDHYRDLEPDVIQTLAGLPSTAEAYAKQTIDPLDPDKYPNMKGPDFEKGDPGPGYETDSGNQLCAWVDSFDGQTRRRYFYRTATVNEAGQRSDELSYPTQPVQAVDTVAPTSPSPNRITAGHHKPEESDDRAITLRWDPSPERDTVKYRVYHTFEAESKRDIRLMEKVATVSQSDDDSLVWSDTNRHPMRTHFYRITAIDGNGNESDPSPVLTGRSFQLTHPDSPKIEVLEWVHVDDDGSVHPVDADPPPDQTWRRAISLEWSLQHDTLESLVEFQVGSNTFQEASGWLAKGTHSFVHSPVTWGKEMTYRIAVRNDIGMTNQGYNVETLRMGDE